MTRKKFVKLMMCIGYPKNYANAVIDLILDHIRKNGIPKGKKFEYWYQLYYFNKSYKAARENSANVKKYNGKKPWKNTQRNLFLSNFEEDILMEFLRNVG